MEQKSRSRKKSTGAGRHGLQTECGRFLYESGYNTFDGRPGSDKSVPHVARAADSTLKTRDRSERRPD